MVVGRSAPVACAGRRSAEFGQSQTFIFAIKRHSGARLFCKAAAAANSERRMLRPRHFRETGAYADGGNRAAVHSAQPCIASSTYWMKSSYKPLISPRLTVGSSRFLNVHSIS